MRLRPDGSGLRLATLALAAAAAGSALARPSPVPGLSPDLRCAIADGQFVVEVRAHRGDGWWRLAERAGLDPRRWKVLQAANGGLQGPRAGRDHRVPPELWPEGLGERVVRAHFPEARPDGSGWRHVVRARSALGRSESAWALAELYAGDGRLHERLLRPPGVLRPGQVVLIPDDLVLPHLRPAAGGPDGGGDGLEPVAEDQDDAGFLPPPGSRSADGLLAFDVDDRGPHATYRLRAGETLYSHVVLRFTGRLSGAYVNEAARAFARDSGIDDVTDIPVGHPIRIPLSELRPEYLPVGHPRRTEWEREREESARLALVDRRSGLEGVHVVVDAGHGGTDPGASSDRVWEDDYAYDIACRLMAVLSESTHASVHALVRDESSGHAPLARIRKDTDEVLLTTPALRLDSGISTSVAVHARWILANDLHHRLARRGSDDDMVFLSIHADSLHRSASGGMAYYPGARFRPARYQVPDSVARLRIGEARASSAFRMTRRESLRAEGLSRRLGEAIVASFRAADVPVHGYSPVRSHVVRRSAWVPAVLRFNRIPASVLVEACNINNPDDQRRLRDPTFRQAVAEAVAQGLLDYFDGRETPARAGH